MAGVGSSRSGPWPMRSSIGTISGDFGGGGDLSRFVIWHAVRDEDGRGEPTMLRRAVTDHFGLPTVNDVVIALHVGDITLNSATREIHQGEKRIELTGAEFDLLAVLLNAAGKIVSRETISQTALGRPLLAYDRSIDVHISNLRRKLGPAPGGGERIKAVRGIGYLYAGAVDTTEQGAAQQDAAS